jgi:hypothetical protein
MPVDRIVSSVPFLIARALLMVVGLAACGRPPHLVDGPLEVSGQAMTFRLDRPAPAGGPLWELCFEFDTPRDSHRAGDIQATLLSAAWERAVLDQPSLDRRGESTVCQVGRLESCTLNSSPVSFQGLELESETTLPLRGIRGGSLPP